MKRTLLDECFRVEGRQTCYMSADEIQRDLDLFMRHYNLERSHQAIGSTAGRLRRPCATT